MFFRDSIPIYDSSFELSSSFGEKRFLCYFPLWTLLIWSLSKITLLPCLLRWLLKLTRLTIDTYPTYLIPFTIQHRTKCSLLYTPNTTNATLSKYPTLNIKSNTKIFLKYYASFSYNLHPPFGLDVGNRWRILFWRVAFKGWVQIVSEITGRHGIEHAHAY